MIDAILIGILQGITEFLPVSSSGHILYAGKMSLIPGYQLPLWISVHMGTVISIVLYFRKRIKKMLVSLVNLNSPEYRKEHLLWKNLIIASIPAAIVGILFDSYIEKIATLTVLGYCWIINGIILIAGELLSKNKRNTDSNDLLSAIVIGIFQAIAILPGISRSGATITAARNMGFSPERAFEFSFFLGILTITGGFILELAKSPGSFTIDCFIAGVSGFISGYIALMILSKAVQKAKMKWFGVYTIIAGFITLAQQ